MKNKESFLPKLVYQLCVRGALLAGSRAFKEALHPFCEGVECNDYDLLVPYEKWNDINLLIPKNAVVNSFGGWKFKTKDFEGREVEVDVWPDDPMNYLRKASGEIVFLFDPINQRIFSSHIKKDITHN